MLLALLWAPLASAQVDVTATAGTAAASYTTLKGAFDAINAGTHQGTIAIGISGDTTETAPAVLNASASGAAVYSTISIQPTGGAARTISGAIVAGSPLIDFNGADNVTINGLNTGGNSLTIANTTVSATSGTSTIRFIGGATLNTITNANIQGSGTMSVATNGAVIFFSTDANTATGNDNNIISNNNIGPAAGNLPTKAILGNGSTTTTAIGNSGMVINNNNIFDYFGAAVTSAGIATNGGCNAWTITNNRFYQTGTRTWTTGSQHTAINIGNTSANSGAQAFTISFNTIGYASNTQTGTYTLTGTGSGAKFIGILFNGIVAGTTTNIVNNTVAAVSMTGVTGFGGTTSSPFTGIFFQEGNGITNGNTIGSQSATGSLVFSTTTTSNTEVYGIHNFSSNIWTSNNNTVGGISVTNLGASGNFVIAGMRAFTNSTGTWSANGNSVGGTVANSIQLSATGTASQVMGMFSSNAPTALTTNTVRNLTSNIGTGTSGTASVIGINITAFTLSHTLSRNTISNLSNSNATAATVVTGIQFNGATANLVERNSIFGLTVASNSAAAEVNGIRVAGGTTVYRNNMIAMGAGIANAIGTGSTTGGINGINEPLGTNSFFHNSVYIGGAPSAGVGPSYAFNSSQTVNTRSFRDNIFFNARSNAGATGKNYVVRVGGTAANPAGLTINNNLYFANGTGAVFGFFNGLDVANLAAWKTAVGQDSVSFESNPQFNDPTNATPDLHLHPTNATVAEGNGVDVGVTDDFDGQTRASFTPTDIGADAGNYVGVDLAPPAIGYSLFANTSQTSNRTLSVTISDITGVATGGSAPRIYYRKNAGSYFSQACSLASGTVNSGSWDCIINNADMGGVVAADVIGYFVIAQDTVGNLASNPTGAVASDVNTVTTPPAAPSTYTIVTAFSGPIPVGPAETYTSLTNPGGIFEAINAGSLSGNVTINITGDLTTETGTHALNQWAEDGVGSYTLLIRPSGASRTVSGTNAGALIRLNGADRVTIDGSTTGGTATGVGGNAALRELTIQNTNVGAAAVVIAVQSGAAGAQNDAIRNVNVLGQDPTTTLAGITLGGATPGTAGTDNDGNRIENCTVKRSIYGVYSAGQNAANPNSGTVFTMNDMSATGTDRLRRIGMVVFNESGVQITLNSIGGLDTNESADGIAIGVGTQGIDNVLTTAGGVTGALVSRNRISGVNSQSATGFSAAGIAVAGSPGAANVIANNMITGVISPATSPDIVAGVYVAGVAGTSTRVLYNSIAMSGDRGAVATQMPSFGVAITGVDPTVELKNNAFVTTQISSGGGANAKSYAIGMGTTTFANLDANYNDYFSSGANAGFFRSGSLNAGAGTDYATVALWAAAVADDANSLQIDPPFVSATDLHLQPASTLIGAGTPVTGVTVDFDGEARSALTPSIGADEIAIDADLSITKTDGVTTAAPGGSVTYTITASNAGPASTTGTVTDTFAAPLTCTWTCAGAGGGTCTAAGSGNLADPIVLPSGGSVSYTATCAISSAATGTLVNTANVTGVANDPNAANNSATDTDTLVASADLVVTKTDGLVAAVPGTNTTYTMTVGNVGPSNTTATVVDTLPPELTCAWTCSGAGGGICSASGSGNINDAVVLPAGGLLTYTAVCAINPAATSSLSNTLTANGAVPDPQPSDNSATDTNSLLPTADVSVTKTDGVTSAIPGINTTYTITASNAGPSSTTATIADSLPPELTCNWTCVGAGGGTCAATGSGSILDLVSLPSGGSITYTLNCAILPSATGTLVNNVLAVGAALDPVPGNNNATDTDTLTPQANLAISKTDGVATATPGTTTAYTIVASNPGPSVAPGSIVTDTFPADCVAPTWTCVGAGGGTCAAAGSGNIADTVNLPVGGSVSYTAQCPINAAATGSLTNTATVATAGGIADPTPGDNSATDTDTLGSSADLSITKTDGSTGEVPGTPVTYTIVASNAGPGAVTGATVADAFAGTLSACSWTCVGAGGGTCTAAGSGNLNDTVNLPVSSSVTYTATCTIAASATGSLVNTATVAVPAGATDPTPGNNNATDTDTLTGSADLATTVTDSPDPVIAGANVTWTATTTNNGPSDVQGVTVTVPAPLFTAQVSLTASAGGVCGGSICTWAAATAPGVVRTATLVALVGAGVADGTQLSATATAGPSVGDPVPANNEATTTTTVNAAADLSVVLTDTPDPVTAGSNLTYTATLSNAGLSDAQGANIALPMPATTTFVSAATSAGGSCSSPAVGANGTVTCTWAGATVPGPGGARTATIIVNVPASTAHGAILNAAATAGATTTDPALANNTASAATGVVGSADLSVTLTDTPDPVVAGSNISYLATLSNAGLSDAQGANIALPLPATTTFVSVSASAGGTCSNPAVGANGTVTCTWAGATAPGAGNARSMTVVAAVPALTANGTVLNATATAGSTTTDPALGDNSASTTTTVNSTADVAITLIDSPDPVAAGSNLTYTATVSNAGPSDATGVVVTLPLPTGTTLVSAAVSGGGSCAGAPLVCTLTGDMAAATSRTVTVVVAVGPAVVSGTVLSATATVASTSTDPNAANDTASTTTTVSASADLLLSLSASATQALANVPVTFTATSLNQGPSDAQNLSITITLTPDFRFSSVTATGATCSAPQVGTVGVVVCTWAGATAPGVTRTLAVVAYSNVEGGSAVNASTASDTPDPVTNNNLGGVSVQVGYLTREIPGLGGLGLLLLSLLIGMAGVAAMRRQG